MGLNGILGIIALSIDSKCMREVQLRLLQVQLIPNCMRVSTLITVTVLICTYRIYEPNKCVR